MKYTNSVRIHRDRNLVLRLFLDTRYLRKWMKGLYSFHTVQGQKGRLGSRTRMVFQMGKKQKVFYQTSSKKVIRTAMGFSSIVNMAYRKCAISLSLWQTNTPYSKPIPVLSSWA